MFHGIEFYLGVFGTSSVRGTWLTNRNLKSDQCNLVKFRYLWLQFWVSIWQTFWVPIYLSMNMMHDVWFASIYVGFNFSGTNVNKLKKLPIYSNNQHHFCQKTFSQSFCFPHTVKVRNICCNAQEKCEIYWLLLMIWL